MKLASSAVCAPGAQRKCVNYIIAKLRAVAPALRSPRGHAARAQGELKAHALPRRQAVLGTILAWAALPTLPASAIERLGIEEVQARLIKCFEDDQYYVSGMLDRGIFEDGCVFTDPTINVAGTS